VIKMKLTCYHFKKKIMKYYRIFIKLTTGLLTNIS